MRYGMEDVLPKGVVADFLRQLSRTPRSALLLDYDGTLAPFQTERNRAFPYSGIIPLLENIIRSGRTRVVIISGRPVREIQTLLDPLTNLEIWGAHGMEHVLADGTYRQATIDSDIAAALEDARKWAVAMELASLLEIKPGGVAIHWRGMPQSEIERIQALAPKGWTSLAKKAHLRFLNFDGGVELRAVRPNKGDAVTAVLNDSDRNTQVAFLGDDLTDEDGFVALEGHGLSVLVREEYRNTKANAWLRPPHELIAFLKQWLDSVSA